MNIQAHIEKVREALQKASPGPWSHHTSQWDFAKSSINDVDIHTVAFCDELDAQDAHLISNSPTWLQDSLDIIEQQQREIEKLREALEWIEVNFDSEKSGLSDSQYHKQMLEIVKEVLNTPPPNKEVSKDEQ